MRLCGGGSGAETSLFFNAQSSLKLVRPSKNRLSSGKKPKKTIKNIIHIMVLSRPFRLLDTTFNILILTLEDLRHNRKAVPMSCRYSAYYVL